MTKDKKSDPEEAKNATDREIPARMARSEPPASALAGVKRQTQGATGFGTLKGVTYIHVSDAQGRMDEDLFDILCEKSGEAR